MEIVLPEDRPRVVVTVDGLHMVISPVLKTDSEFFRRGLAEMSIESRFSRFGQGVAYLSDREIEYLTDVDQTSHVAFGAAVDGEVAGVGRYVSTDDQCPEVALTVIDSHQGRGVGTVLFAALAAVARNDSLGELCFEASSENEAVRHLLQRLEINPGSTDGTFYRRIRLSDLPSHPLEEEFVGAVLEIRAKR